MMDLSFVHLILLLFAVITPLILYLSRRTDHCLPPGPWPLPIIGNLHQLNACILHRKLQSLSRIHGPIMSLRLGCVPTIVVSSPQMAEAFLKIHDVAFSSRPGPEVVVTVPNRDRNKTVLFAPCNRYWRLMRRVLITCLLCKDKTVLRKEIVQKMVGRITGVAAVGVEVVDVSEVVREGMGEMACRMMLGCWGEREGVEVGRIVREVLTLGGAVNVGDYLPFLRPFDVQVSVRRPSLEHR